MMRVREAIKTETKDEHSRRGWYARRNRKLVST